MDADSVPAAADSVGGAKRRALRYVCATGSRFFVGYRLPGCSHCPAIGDSGCLEVMAYRISLITQRPCLVRALLPGLRGGGGGGGGGGNNLASRTQALLCAEERAGYGTNCTRMRST